MADPLIETLVPVDEGVEETPLPKVAKPPRVRKPKATPVPSAPDPLALLTAKLDALTELVTAQTTLLTALLARPAVIAPPVASTPQGGPGGLKVVGERGSRYPCPCLGRDGKAHGLVTVNRFGNCPDCYTDAHFAKNRKAA